MSQFCAIQNGSHIYSTRCASNATRKADRLDRRTEADFPFPYLAYNFRVADQPGFTRTLKRCVATNNAQMDGLAQSILILLGMVTDLRRRDVDEDPNLKWNTFVGILASGPDGLAVEQRPASLVFLYESEVQNGGHLQYFLNRTDDPKEETIAALVALDAVALADILKAAYSRWTGKIGESAVCAEEFVEEALADELGDFDSAYYSAEPTAIKVLEHFFDRNEAMFIRVID